MWGRGAASRQERCECLWPPCHPTVGAARHHTVASAVNRTSPLPSVGDCRFRSRLFSRIRLGSFFLLIFNF